MDTVEEPDSKFNPVMETDTPTKEEYILKSKLQSAEVSTDEKRSTVALTLKGNTLQVLHSETEKSSETDTKPTVFSSLAEKIKEDQCVDMPKIVERPKCSQKESKKIDKDEKITIKQEKQNENEGIQETTKLKDEVKKTSRRTLKTPEREINKPIEELEKATPRTRKRAKSTSSNKSAKESDSVEMKTEEIKTPRTRKRSQSIASTKSDDKTPEKSDTPSRRRVKTPTSSEVCKIVTRRVSKEISEKVYEFESSIIDETATPKRRSTRARSKQDDEVSVASGSSVKSIISIR